MSEPIERCLCGTHCKALQLYGKWAVSCRVCCYETPPFDSEPAAITTHNRMMRAGRGEAVGSAIEPERLSPLELARRIQDEWARIVSQLEKETGK